MPRPTWSPRWPRSASIPPRRRSRATRRPGIIRAARAALQARARRSCSPTSANFTPRRLKALDVEAPVVGFEIFLDACRREKEEPRASRRLHAADLLPVRRDFAFVLEPPSRPATWCAPRGPPTRHLIASVSVFDVFEGGSARRRGQEVACDRGHSATHDRDADGQGDRGGRAEDRRRGKGRDRRRDSRLSHDPRGASDHRLEVDLALVQEAGFREQRQIEGIGQAYVRKLRHRLCPQFE